MKRMAVLLAAALAVLGLSGHMAAAETGSGNQMIAGEDVSRTAANGSGNQVTAGEDVREVLEEAEITVFAAKSLNAVMDALIAEFQVLQPAVSVVGNYDSSGALMIQIEEGALCDLFFSAAQKQMDELEEKGFVVPDTRVDIVGNRVCVVTWTGSGTGVTGLSDLGKAGSMALAAGSVPVGKYTREALVSAGILEEREDNSTYTTAEVSEALGGLLINECANVGAVTAAVAEQVNEVGTVYFSDLRGREDDLEILEMIPYDLTGEVTCPAAGIVNPEATPAQSAAASAFLEFLTSGRARQVFRDYHFDTDV